MSTAVAEAKPTDTVNAVLERMKPEMARVLPKHLTPDRMLRVALTTIRQTPKLLECDRASLYAAIMTCAQLGLEPDGVLGQAYLVPFKGKVQFIPGYKGYIDLARRSGDVVSIQAKEVREGDHFVYAFGLEEKLEHVPAAGSRDKPITHFWFKATFKDGGYHWDVMTVDEVNAIRDGSQGYCYTKSKNRTDTPWIEHYAEMGKKTIIRRNAKYLPMSVQRAAVFENAIDKGAAATVGPSGDIIIEAEAQPANDKAEAAPSSRLEQFAEPEPAKPAAEFIPYPKNKAAKQHADDLINGIRAAEDQAALDAFCAANLQGIDLLKSRDPDQAQRVADEIDGKLDSFQASLAV